MSRSHRSIKSRKAHKIHRPGNTSLEGVCRHGNEAVVMATKAIFLILSAMSGRTVDTCAGYRFSAARHVKGQLGCFHPVRAGTLRTSASIFVAEPCPRGGDSGQRNAIPRDETSGLVFPSQRREASRISVPPDRIDIASIELNVERR
ncbi:hypothetical protein Bbelb_322950 [Branchiostoma belcheri]|nr:hypothetical protein Bbelb_322950 [Branchiostoma belcheri]